MGDPIYGLDERFVDDFLNHHIEDEERLQVSGAARLMLHAYHLEFTFLNNRYIFFSKQSSP